MKGLPFAALLALGLLQRAPLAGADEGAYKNLVGMAKAAETERGPDAGDAPERASTGTEALKDALADVPAPRSPSSPKTGAAAGAAAAPVVTAGAEVSTPGPAVVAVPPPAKPRLWTRLYSTLLPSWRRPPSLQSAFDPMVSTVSFRASMAPLPALMPPPDSEAVSAGERRGLAELLSVSSPTGGK
ncbi:MAG: hypothetical protein ACHQ2Z_02185 [Elusimicrobiota bacterium]